MSAPDLFTLPREARGYQGAAAGVVTRVSASIVDAVVVALSMVLLYGGVAAFLFILSPRDFTLPRPSLMWSTSTLLALMVTYLTLAWWIGGRSVGDRVMGVRVVSARGRVGFWRSLARAVFCTAFPLGLLWCVFDSRRRSVQDLAVRTSVVYDWLAEPRHVPQGGDPLPRPRGGEPRSPG